MFPAALVALVVGGPLGACLFLAYGAMHAMKIAKVDARYADRGETPPSYALINRMLERRTAAGQKPSKTRPVKYGMWRYGLLRWQAMWEDMATDFAARHAADRKARDDASAQGLPEPPQRTLKDKLTALKGWKWQINAPTPVPENTATLADLMGGPAPTRPAETETEGPRTACEDCGQTLRQVDDAWTHPSSAGCPRKPVAPPTDLPVAPEAAGAMGAIQRERERRNNLTPEAARAEERWREEENRKRANQEEARMREPGIPEPNVQNGDGSRPPQPARTPAPLNDPVPNRAGDTTNEGDTTMANTAEATIQHSGEVTGTRSAVIYAKAMADAHAAHGGNEAFITSLANMEVGDGDIAKVRAAMEASANAAAAWAGAAESIEANNARIREAYAQAPDAANKAANINE